MREELQMSSEVPASCWVWYLDSVEKREGEGGPLIYSVVSMNHLHSGRALPSLPLSALPCLSEKQVHWVPIVLCPFPDHPPNPSSGDSIPFQSHCPASFREVVELGSVPEEEPSYLPLPSLPAQGL